MRIFCVFVGCALWAMPAAAQTSDQLAGWGFGIALGFSDNLRGSDSLSSRDDVSIDEQGILRIDRVSNVSTHLLFELHHTYRLASGLAVGPYVSVLPGDSVIEGVGAGAAFELFDPGSDAPSMVLGVGALVRLNSLKLGEGFEDGRPVFGERVRFTEREELELSIWIGVGF